MVKWITFNTKNVQKFHPGICTCPSERFTSASLCVKAESNAARTPSLSLVTNSAQAAGCSKSDAHTSCTHLRKGSIKQQQQRSDHIPILLVSIEVCPDLVQHGSLHLKHALLGCPSLRPDNVYYEPFLVFALTDDRMPIPNLLLHSILIRVVVLASLL